MKPSEYRSSGKEPYLFKVDDPRNLFGPESNQIGGWARWRWDNLTWVFYFREDFSMSNF